MNDSTALAPGRPLEPHPSASGPAGARLRLPTLATALAGALVAAAAPAAGQTPPAVVVAPFTNVSRQPADDWIGAGIAETIAVDLQEAGLEVVGHGGDEPPRLGRRGPRNGPGPAALDAWRRQGVAWVIDGALQRSGTDLRITARIVDVETGEVEFGARVDGGMADLFDVQDELASTLAARLATSAGGRSRRPARLGRQPEPATRAGGRSAPPVGGAPAFGSARAGLRAPRAPAAIPPRPPAASAPGSVRAPRAPAAIPRAAPEAPVNGALAFGSAPAGRDAGPRRRAGGGTAPGGTRRDGVDRGPGPRRRTGGGGGFAPTPLGRPTAVIERTNNPPEIDGRLDDSVWETAAHLTDFIQIAPIEGAPGTEETEVWMAYDSDHLYFAFYAHYSRPETMRINRADREEIRGDDRMSILFDPFLDQQRAYQFEVNGYGVQSDSIVNADGSTGFSRSSASGSASRGSGPRRSGGSGMSSSGQFGIRGDDSWNALFDSAGRVVSDGWTAEMRIPFKSLRYPSRGRGQPHRWGFQITRVIRDKSEAQSWSPISRGVAGQLTQFGALEGLSDLSASRNLEFLPEVTGFRFGELDTASGAYAEDDPTGQLGFGVKYGITPNLTADFTYNPDFSQIESDRPQVETNQRFALFYPEQRPFFLEGQEVFQTATPMTLVHTRTIVDPRFGGKLTGKVGQATLGVVVADDEAAGGPGDAAQTVLGRARYDFYAESYLGGIMTAREFGADYNRVAGVDGRFRLGRTHRLSFLAAGAETRCSTGPSPGSLLAACGEGGWTADGAAGSISGSAVEADFSKQGRNLSYNAAYSRIDPGFWTDTGFLPRLDLQQASGTASYRWWPESTLMTWGPSVTYLRLYDHAGVLQDEQLQGSASFSFRNNMAVTGMVNRDLERYEGFDFRKTGFGFFGVMSARILSIYGGYNWGDGIYYQDTAAPWLGWSTVGNVNFRFQPTSRLRTEFTMVSSHLVEPTTETAAVDVKIFRTRTTYQFTDRLLARYILEHNTAAETLGNNVLFTYRVNAGTVIFLGYDDRYQRGDLLLAADARRLAQLADPLFNPSGLLRQNRTFFGKISYLFRY